MKQCKECGVYVPDSANVCPYCQSSFSAQNDGGNGGFSAFMKRWGLLALVLVILLAIFLPFAFNGVASKKEATKVETAPSLREESEAEKLFKQHDFPYGINSGPQYCRDCGAFICDVIGHEWTTAKENTPSVCRHCLANYSEFSCEHDYSEPTIIEPGKCKKCGKTGTAMPPIHGTWEMVKDKSRFQVIIDAKDEKYYILQKGTYYCDLVFSGKLYKNDDYSLKSDEKGGWLFTLVTNEKLKAGGFDEDDSAWECKKVSESTTFKIYDDTKTTKGSSSATSKSSSTPTMGEANALLRACDYLYYFGFSKEGLIEQLEYEGYTTSEAKYAADNCGADWNEQAAIRAAEYLRTMPFSRSGLIEQLEYEGFTYSQAVYGVEQNGY